MDSFGNAENQAAAELWIARYKLLIEQGQEELPSMSAKGAQAREFGIDDPNILMPAAETASLEVARRNPEALVRNVEASGYAAITLIIEMMKAHWAETGTPLSPIS